MSDSNESPVARVPELTDEQILFIAKHHFKEDASTEPETLKAYCDSVRAVIVSYGLDAPQAPAASTVDRTPPFSNCRFRECDLPGQCRSEGKCHHPVTTAPARSEQESDRDAYYRGWNAAITAFSPVNASHPTARAEGGETVAEGFEVALNALAEYQANWDTGLAQPYAESERIAMECAVDAVRDALNEARGTVQNEAIGNSANPNLVWAVGRWFAEVADRPLKNVHRRSLDDTWRQVIRHLGGDPEKLLGPSHDALLAATPVEAKGGKDGN